MVRKEVNKIQSKEFAQTLYKKTHWSKIMKCFNIKTSYALVSVISDSTNRPYDIPQNARYNIGSAGFRTKKPSLVQKAGAF
jgi:hypothetical protein